MKAKSATSESTVTLDVSLLGREYKVACKPGEEDELREAVAFLDARMREIRDAHKVQSTERIAVMAALNLVHEFRRGRATPKESDPSAKIDAPSARRRIAGMRSAIDQALSGQEKLL
ncbi:MAG TPA: cell division protein ZapA [Casimicrobiaceae bacterium]|nr:cell division protein ZapA [Casimicrobiaceae bacterium]